ncbi:MULTISPECIES: sigma-70 family RNA polymerase sigma factor [unclassified Myroides]|uniref:RNA polymerase sigma factor n=1 Tax=unclassified Myroides TaxID=2642485 RepID=UPI0015F926B8|nr:MULTISPECIES: sigma-70 family RNA polymerase sigma factor [unclassified Myroides]MBB1149478.1 sigma-70 family RNA polymerase sigma factor [Myroides sp. NP-2]MDM1406613.1 sigma-70 family RNA polymerase sigma factor [Myroides sp. DF42-4-2]
MKQKSLELEFVSLLDEHQNLIHKICRLYTDEESAHKDLFQEISIQLWKAYPGFRGESKFTTWAYRIGLNTAISLFRKKTRQISTTSYDPMIHHFHYNEYNEEEEQQLKLMYKALHQLNDIDKALVFLYLESKTYEEIAETLGISEVNARVKMNRIKSKLKKILNP